MKIIYGILTCLKLAVWTLVDSVAMFEVGGWHIQCTGVEYK